MKFYVHVLPFRSALARMGMNDDAIFIKGIPVAADVWDNYYVCDMALIRAGCFCCDDWYVPINCCDVDHIDIEDNDRDTDDELFGAADTIMEASNKLRSIEIKLRCLSAYAEGACQPDIAVQARKIMEEENLKYFA